jgi:hypothetical protein
MTFLKDLMADLFERRLWPIALGLLVALVAVPTLLSEPGAPDSTAPPASGALTGSISSETQPVVNVSQGYGKNFRRRVRRLARKNPFIQQAIPTPPPTSKPGQGSSAPAGGLGAGAGAGAGAGGGTLAPPTTQPSPTTGEDLTDAVKDGDAVLFQYTAAVNFGEVGQAEKKSLKALDPLPSRENPVVVFMGVLTDGGTAVFLVSQSVTSRGEGECKPSRDQCTFVHLKKGDVRFFEVPNPDGTSVTTYELELREIRVKKIEQTEGKSSRRRATGASARASAERARESRRERAVLGVFDLIGF